ncbi:hypothetical protein D3C73_1481050 [compost metagenome]
MAARALRHPSHKATAQFYVGQRQCVQLGHRTELLRQAAHANMRAKVRDHTSQRGDLLVAFDEAMGINLQKQATRQGPVFRQHQG